MSDELKQIVQRTQRYWYIDGLAEIAGGVIILLLSLLYLLSALLPKGAFNGWILGIGQPVVILLSAWGARKAVNYWKERLTYPRTGYVSYPRKHGTRRWVAALIAGCTAISVAIMIAVIERALALPGFENWLPVFTGGIISVCFAVLAYQYGLKRFYIQAGVAFLIGLLTVLTRLPERFSTPFFFAGLGLSWVLSGIWTLVHYLRITTPLAQEPEV